MNIYEIAFFESIYVKKHRHRENMYLNKLLTSYLTLWKSLALLSRTVSEWLGFWSPLKMKDMSPLSHLISLKSTRVVSILIEAPLL